MNSVDEELEKVEDIGENDKDEPAENEECNNSDDLAQKKVTENKFNVKGNSGHYQLFIQNLDNLYTNYIPDQETKKSRTFPEKNYDLRNIDECVEFIEKYRDGEYLATAIIMCIFEAVPLGDLSDLKLNLMEYLPSTEVLENEGTIINSSQQEPYLSLNTILKIIGGERFLTEDGQQCIGLGENSIQALINIWEQFPALHSPVVSWLLSLSEIHEYRTTFGTYQIATAFARIISLDFVGAKKRIMSQLYSNHNNIGLLGTLAYKLCKEVGLWKEMEPIFSQWTKYDSTWLWKPACLVYHYFMENGKSFTYETDLIKIIKKQLLQTKKTDLTFISALLCQSRHFRTMLTGIFYTSYLNASTRDQKLTWAQIYVNIVRRCYYLVDDLYIELPLVSCDTKEQQNCLTHIIVQVMYIYRLRKQIYVIMEAYLKEISSYSLSINVINHISAYFYNMALAGTEYKQDVIAFLKNCHNKAAKQIYDRWNRTYDKSNKGGVLHE